MRLGEIITVTVFDSFELKVFADPFVTVPE